MKCFICLKPNDSGTFYEYIFATKLTPILGAYVARHISTERVIKTVFKKDLSHVKKIVAR